MPVRASFPEILRAAYPSDLRAAADGAALAIEVEEAASGGFVARGVLPARAGAGLTTLRFTCPKVGSPRDEGFNDERVLGLLFFRLEVEEAGAQAMSGAAERAIG